MFDSEVLRDHVSSQVNIANERKKYSESKTIPGGGGVFLLLYKLSDNFSAKKSWTDTWL